MSKCIRLAAFTFVAAFVFLMCGESHARPGLDGIDEHGRRVNVIDVDRYLKKNPYRPPAKKKAPARKPAPKKPAPKPKPKPKVTEVERMRRIAQEEIKKAEARKVAASKKWDTKTAATITAAGAGTGAIIGSTALGAGTGPGALGGAVTGLVGYTVSVALENVKDLPAGYKKVSVLEDPMGRCHP